MNPNDPQSRPLRRLAEHELCESLSAALRAWRPHQDVWLFAYGSLIFDPPFDPAERRAATVYGYHRAMNVWSRVYRGTFAYPGLTMGLDRGGACRGVALRVPAARVKQDLAAVWQREMPLATYKPVWVSAHFHKLQDKSLQADYAVNALTFIVDRAGANYAGRLAEEQVLEVLIKASGSRGPCHEYLLRTIAGLAAYGVVEPALDRLASKVRQQLAQPSR